MLEIVKWSLTDIMVDLVTMVDDTTAEDMVVVIINVEEVGITSAEEVVITKGKDMVVKDIGGDLNIATIY